LISLLVRVRAVNGETSNPPCDHSEALYENEAFPERELAALVAAKIYYHLQEYDESMVFALAAGKLFNIEQEGEFEDTIIGTADACRIWLLYPPS